MSPVTQGGLLERATFVGTKYTRLWVADSSEVTSSTQEPYSLPGFREIQYTSDRATVPRVCKEPRNNLGP